MSAIGFSGTSGNLTLAQRREIHQLLEWLRVDYEEFHHGDCVGADEYAAEVARSLGYRVHVHPPVLAHKRAFSAADVTHQAKDYLARNRDIAIAAEILIAAPATAQEVVRSGTWSTVRYARKLLRPIRLVPPDGIVRNL